MKHSRAFLFGLLAAVAVAFAASSLCMVAPGEIAVVRRFGRLVEPAWGPGLHWCYPLGIDRIDRVRSDAVRQFTIGLARAAASDVEPGTGEMLTGDLNLVRIEATVQYRVARPEQFVLRAEGVEPLLTDAGEASVSRVLATRGIDAVLRTDRQGISRDVERDLQGVSDRYGQRASATAGSMRRDRTRRPPPPLPVQKPARSAKPRVPPPTVLCSLRAPAPNRSSFCSRKPSTPVRSPWGASTSNPCSRCSTV
jgi:membrane protease subunit HflK